MQVPYESIEQNENLHSWEQIAGAIFNENWKIFCPQGDSGKEKSVHTQHKYQKEAATN